MTQTATATGDGDDPREEGDRADLSVLGNLGRRKQQLVKQLFMDRPVPRWSNPSIHVRYQPLDHPLFRAMQQKVDKASKADKARVEVETNADLLIKACVGVYATLDGVEEGGPHDDGKLSLVLGDPNAPWTKFDPDLAAQLLDYDPEAENATPPTARAVVRALFLTDADLLQHSAALAQFSGYRMREVEDELGEG